MCLGRTNKTNTPNLLFIILKEKKFFLELVILQQRNLKSFTIIIIRDVVQQFFYLYSFIMQIST
jgi:hypothetical protein